MEMIYWIIWDGDREPLVLRVKSWVEFIDLLNKYVMDRGSPPEHILRKY